MTPTCIETVSGKIIDVMDPKREDISITDIAWGLSRISRYGGQTLCKRTYSVAQHSVWVSHYVEMALTEETYENEVFAEYIEEAIMKAAGHDGNAEDFAYWCKMKDMMNMPMKDEHRRRQYALHGLAHDGHEAYLTDIPTPIKCIPGIREALKPVEEKLDALIFPEFYIESSPTRWPDNWKFSKLIVKWADMKALQVEAYHMMPSRGKTWDMALKEASLGQLLEFKEPMKSGDAAEIFLRRLEYLMPKDNYPD